MLEFVGDSRRLPVYLLIDTSGSMAGPPMLAVNAGLEIFQKVIREDANCRDSVHACVLCFDSVTRVAAPLTEAATFQAPKLTSQGGTAYSLALDMLREEIKRNQKPKSEDYAGDYKPLAFFFTDGAPNPGDPWESALERLNERKGLRPQFIAIGAGAGADETVLRRMAPEHTYMLADLDDPSKVQALFKWIANSTVAASQQAGANPAGGLTLGSAPANLFG